jgi:hypothetical protein
VFRLAFLSVLLAACTTPSLSTYDDKDPAIENGGSGDGSCTATAFTVTPVTPLIQLMVDGSGTMGEGMSGANSKYDAVKKALYSGTAPLLTNLESKAQFGASVYLSSGTCPSFHASPCTLNNMAGVKNAIDMGNVNGTDPLPEALLALHDTFGNVTGDPKVIVLATDGTPNSCGNPGVDHTQEAVAQALANFNDKHIQLYVMGLGGVDTTFLQDIANAGLGSTTNVPYYSSASLTDVTANYTSIFNAIVDCKMTIDGTIDVAQASLGTVKTNGTTLAYTTDWTAVDDHTIQLVGQACTDYKSAPTAPEITATFTCGSSH